MKDIYKIVGFYNSIIDSNLFKNEELSTKEINTIEKQLDNKNNELIDFIRKNVVSQKLSLELLQGLINELLETFNRTILELK